MDCATEESPEADQDRAAFRGGGCRNVVWAAAEWQRVSIRCMRRGVCAQGGDHVDDLPPKDCGAEHSHGERLQGKRVCL